ncbi:MAG: NADH-quinone oxidoreductase subunit C [Pirellulaceae bacterium]
MNREEQIDRIQVALGERLLKVRRPQENRLYLDVEATVIPESARLLSDQLQARFQTASGVDAPREIEILYHWVFDAIELVVTVCTKVDRQQPELPSIAGICPAAEWIEREMWELLGISFPGHPDQRHLLLDDEWPEGKYPLRRDYQKD